MSDKILLNSKDWGGKISNRSKDRMKITFKLNKQEATAFKNWTEIVKPDNVDDEVFVKQIFFRGVEAFNEVMNKIIEGIKNDPEAQAKLAAQGIDLAKLSTSGVSTEAPVTENPVYVPPVETKVENPIFDIRTRQKKS